MPCAPREGACCSAQADGTHDRLGVERAAAFSGSARRFQGPSSRVAATPLRLPLLVPALHSGDTPVELVERHVLKPDGLCRRRRHTDELVEVRGFCNQRFQLLQPPDSEVSVAIEQAPHLEGLVQLNDAAMQAGPVFQLAPTPDGERLPAFVGYRLRDELAGRRPADRREVRVRIEPMRAGGSIVEEKSPGGAALGCGLGRGARLRRGRR